MTQPGTDIGAPVCDRLTASTRLDGGCYPAVWPAWTRKAGCKPALRTVDGSGHYQYAPPIKAIKATGHAQFAYSAYFAVSSARPPTQN